jgi:Na+/H+ antiporter NhaD/arsenite permease-like protein
VLEVLAALAVGLIVGAALGTAGAHRLVDALDSELIHLVRHIDASTYAFAAGLVLVVGGLTLAIGIATAPRTPPDGDGAQLVAATGSE